MANKAKIRITFDSNSTLSEVISFDFLRDGELTLRVSEEAVSLRTSSGQYTVDPDFTPVTANNYYNAVFADYYNPESLLIFEGTDISGKTFIEFTARGYGASFQNVNIPTNVTSSITAEVLPDPVLPITDYAVQPPQSNPACTHQRIVPIVENAVYPVEISASGATKTATTESDLWIELKRYLPGEITLTDDTGATDSITPDNVALWEVGLIDVQEFEAGATVIINVDPTTAGGELNYQYSLNGVDWVSYNSLTGILAGTYTAYVRDSFNCVQTKEFTVEGLTTPRPDPLFRVEKANPLRFVDTENPEFRNVENTLYNDQDIPNLEKYYFRQPFQLGSVVRTQIKTSYRNLIARVYDDCTDKVIQEITPSKKVENIGQEDKRDCFLTGNLATGKAQIFFPQGNIYTPGTSNVISSYSSRGPLPSFARVGMVVDLSSVGTISGTPVVTEGSYQVKSISYNENVGYWVLDIDATIEFPPGTFSAICESTYNAEPFDIFEFSFTQNKGQYRVEIQATDSSSAYPDILFKSEPFLFDNFSELVNLRYSSDDNQSWINYQTGIIFDLMVPGRMFNYSQAGDDETFEDDFGNKQIQKSVYVQQLELQTNLIPAWMAEKIVIASTQEKLQIQGIEVTMAERPDPESMSEQQNPLYTVTGVYRVENNVIRDERTGVVSSTRAVIGADNQTVLGV